MSAAETHPHLHEVEARVVERGAIAFFARPRVDRDEMHTQDDVQRLFVVLANTHGGRRRLAVGRKVLPSREGAPRAWALVDAVGDHDDVTQDLGAQAYATKSRGARVQGAARIVAEGVYALVLHGDHMHLAFEVERAVKALSIPHRGSYVLLRGTEERWVHVAAPEELDREGTHVVLIATGGDPGEQLSIDLTLLPPGVGDGD